MNLVHLSVFLLQIILVEKAAAVYVPQHHLSSILLISINGSSNVVQSNGLPLEDRATIDFVPGGNESESPLLCVLTTSMDDFPPDLFTKTERQHGAILFHFLAAIYFFTILAFVCSEYFLPSVEYICEDLQLSEDVAAATFMATATSMPEFFTNTISTLVADSDMGLGTIMGSMLFNTLGVAALVGLLTKSHVQLDWWPLTRDSIIVLISTSSLVGCLWDEQVRWYEAVVFVVLYFLYFIVMFQNERMKRIAIEFIENRWNLCSRLDKDDISDVFDVVKPGRKYSIAVVEEAVNPAIGAVVSKQPTPVNPQESTTKEPEAERMKLFRISNGSWLGMFWWFYSWPFRFIISLTIPDPRKHRKLYPLTFFMCIVWIGCTSYMVFWMMTIIGSTFEVPETVMGLTFLAFGGCMPEAVSAITVIRKGNGAMGVSNSLGANTLAILFSLGFPWFIRLMMEGGASTGAYIEINSYGMQYSVMALFAAIALLYLVLYIAKFNLRKLVGLALAIGYLIIVTFMILVELDLIFPSNNIC
ncbi:sodium/potassium/calcium exchanger 4-like [Uranotaenia lowii]|uniref:sodium/potassium/calcium exchanger 4-like n=1 Tax=Uranotaenia lowii TaxID=190385 RepID=UPI002478C017|nr:sodium/potassium/calcium exchanger 4-like [Uranotaenia lowii]